MTDTIEQRWAGMTARERDAWVAGKVMGWHVACDRWCVPNPPKQRSMLTGWAANEEGTEPYGFTLGEDDESIPMTGSHRGVWSPSTDIAAAWQVVEKMTSERGFDFTLESLEIPKGKWNWYCRFTFSGSLNLTVKADSAPEAICKAAIRAMGGE